MSNEALEDALLLLELVVVHSRLGCDQVSDCLRVLASDNRVVQHEVVKCLSRVLEEELYHLDPIREGIERDLGALSNRDELLVIVLDTVACEQSQRDEVRLEGILVDEVLGA